MKWTRRFFSFGLVLALLAGVSCTSGDSSPTGPTAAQSVEQPSQSLGTVGDLAGGLVGGAVSGVLGLTNLLTCSSQPYVVTTKTIGPEGGQIVVGSNRLEIPKNALSRKTKITAEQIPGSTNSVRFSPEGLRFEKRAKLTMSYGNCVVSPLKKKIVYTDEGLSILELLKSKDYPKYDYVTSPIDHFSRYAVAY